MNNITVKEYIELRATNPTYLIELLKAIKIKPLTEYQLSKVESAIKFYENLLSLNIDINQLKKM